MPASTVATAVSEDFQLTDLFVAFSGLTVTVNNSLSPSRRLSVFLLRETLLTLTVAGVGGGVGSILGYIMEKNKMHNRF